MTAARPPCGHAGARRSRDDGFTLVEVVITLLLLSVLLAAVGALFVGGVKHAAALGRRQAAVNLAQQALEAARAVSSDTDQNGCVKLLQGRTRTAVDAQWSTAPTGVTAVTDETWTPSGCSGPLILPLQGLAAGLGSVTDPVVLGGQNYTIRTYVGTCVLTAAKDRCLSSAAVPGGGPTLYRLVVDVLWSGSGCDAAGCDYSAATLVDSSDDPVFNVRGAASPVAVADAVCIAAGSPGLIDVIANDTGSLGPSPVTIASGPHKGTLGSSIGKGIMSYTPNGGATGTDTFTYYDTDVNGLISPTATVTVTIGGC